MKKFLRILYIVVFVIAGVFAFTHPVKTETNILRAVFSNSMEDETIVQLSGRYSSKINVLIEADNPETASEKALEFYNAVDKNSFEITDFNISQILEKYKTYSKNLLSLQTALKLEKHKYNEVTGEAFARLYDPMGFMLMPLDEDPFMLFTDYVKSFGKGNPDEFIFNDKYYKIISLEVKNDTALSPELMNGKVKKLTEIQSNISDSSTKIYLTGAPVHSFYASSKSMMEINIICILSSLFVILLCYFYFKSLKLLLPIGISLGLGMLSGYIAASIIFQSIHVLTFVFSTTLIGICVDYSLHYFIEKDLSKILKSLTVSMITTVSAFGILFFSGVELLKQISIFTMTGLFSVYLIVVLFYPLLKFEYTPRRLNFSLSANTKKIIAFIVIFVSFAGIFFLKFNDDIRNMYVPSKTLLSAEKLFADVTGSNKKVSFAVIQGRNIEEMLEKEEQIARCLSDIKFQALSKFIPSEKQQKKNFELRKTLYKNSLKTYAAFLTAKQINNLLNEKDLPGFLKFEKNSPFSDFLIGENTSVMVLYNFDNPEIITQNGGRYVDVQKDISEKIKDCRIACVKMLAPVFILLFLLLSSIYTPRTAGKILTPSILASAFSIGLLSITGQPVNLFHILAIFLIIGFGLDYSVFRAGGVKYSSDAVLLSCATSVFSFLLLVFTSFKLISSLGFILSAGLTVSYITSLLFSYPEAAASAKGDE